MITLTIILTTENINIYLVLHIVIDDKQKTYNYIFYTHEYSYIN